jgi:serine/threonine-protein kinase
MNDDTFSGHPTSQPGRFPGKMVGIFKLEERLGAGGMGEVWKAYDTQGRRHVTIKFLLPDLCANEEAADQMLQAFQASEQLAHPNLCQTLGFIYKDIVNGPHLIMGFVPGIRLSQYRLRSPGQRLSLAKVVEVLAPVAQALD